MGWAGRDTCWHSTMRSPRNSRRQEARGADPCQNFLTNLRAPPGGPRPLRVLRHGGRGSVVGAKRFLPPQPSGAAAGQPDSGG
ncbi:hypothetical protein CO2235_230070 [Cupriavidus oxalaticus]|uniref:Uncharacterized protein n=1 Tax=Cupriavidus oxalaticus TaxID=96344 RepID=A0A375G803_9BURK|nr:hypothetical protein CO2235_230070 [Cupriavidus oxalaticus]